MKIHRIFSRVLVAVLCVCVVGSPAYANCPVTCTAIPTNPDPTSYCVGTYLINCVGTLGNVYLISALRTGVAGLVLVSCDSCGEKGKGEVNGGFGVVTVDTTWTINLPYGIGEVGGGGSSTSVDLSAKLNCQDCKSITAPFIKYNVLVTMGLPYTVEKRVGFMRYVPATILTPPSCNPFDYVIKTLQCPGPFLSTVTYNTLEGALGTTVDNGCPTVTDPCNPCYEE